MLMLYEPIDTHTHTGIKEYYIIQTHKQTHIHPRDILFRHTD